MRRFKQPKLQHPWAKSAAGFTLIELIAVIAIIAILASLSTVGYSGYIKSAKKKSDMFLVGTVMRAIEICSHYTTFIEDDTSEPAAAAYPVGAIVLSHTEDCKVYASSLDSSSTNGATGDVPAPRCVTKKLDKPLVTNYTFIKYCDNTAELDKLGASVQKSFYVYDNLTFASDADMYYCATHTTLPEPRTYYTEYEEQTTYDIASRQQITYYGVIGDEKSAYFVEDMTGIYTFVNAHTDGATLSGTTSESTSISSVSIAGKGNTLYDSIVMAFGDMASLKLTYDKWSSDDPIDLDYSGNYADEMAAFYRLLGNVSEENVITIMVIFENDELHFAISPSAANPRKD